MSEPADLPLFPLGTVLFPKQLLPLHVFEERYKLMIGECLRDSTAFGVVLIKEGREVGEPAKPFEVGTTARIVEMQPLELGRMGLRTVGEQPFRITEITQERPYMRAQVEFQEYEQGSAGDLDSVVASVKAHFSAHLDMLSSLADREPPPVDLAVDPESLSYVVASIMSIEMPEKQRLLELSQADERLRMEASILARENRALQAFVYLKQQSKKEPPEAGQFSGPISPN